MRISWPINWCNNLWRNRKKPRLPRLLFRATCLPLVGRAGKLAENDASKPCLLSNVVVLPRKQHKRDGVQKSSTLGYASARKGYPMSKPKSPFQSLADKVATKLNADLLLYNAPIERHLDQRVIELCCQLKRRKNVALFLVTSGGNADAAYRIAACLQNKYERFLLFVPGYCKSAGTLVALGAHEVVISDQGENGPLDVQMAQKDELISSESGLTATAALKAMNEQAFAAFEEFLLKITKGAGPSLSTKTVADIAIKMTCGLFSHIYQQIDPMHVGEAERALEVAKAYGARLVSRSKNLQGETIESLEHLISHYPSHGFIIDYREAKRIFKNVREFTPDETQLISYLGPLARWPVVREEDYSVVFISTQRAAKRGGAHAKQQKSRPTGQRRGGKATPAATTGAGPAVVPQLPTIAAGGTSKRNP